jgi:hypothetical protein
MGKLFEKGSGYNIQPTEFALTIISLKRLIERDKTRDKSNSLKELAYIYWMYHPDSSYKQSYRLASEGGDRDGRVKTAIFGKDSVWLPDEIMLAAIHFYKEHLYEANPLGRVLGAAEGAFLKLQDYFEGVDMAEQKKNGDLVYSPKDLLQSIEGLDKAALKLIALRRIVTDSLSEDNSQVRGGVKKNKYNS